MLVHVLYPKAGEEKKTASTSKGNQRKWYDKENDRWVKQDRNGYEGKAEWFAYQLLCCSNVPTNWYVSYEACILVHLDGREFSGCYSQNFLQPGDMLIPVQRLMDSLGIDVEEDLFGGRSVEGKVNNLLMTLRLENAPTDIQQYFSFMLDFDAVILNEDRHLNNIALIKDINGNYRVCPLFDHGLSLLSDTSDYPPRYTVDLNIPQVSSKPFSSDFMKQVGVIKGVTPLRFDKQKVIDLLEENKEELGRIYDVMQVQMNKYSAMFVNYI